MTDKATRGIGIMWLVRAFNRVNINAGEGGGNVTELKLYEDATKPYASAQAMRHAIREGVRRVHADDLRCNPSAPCGDVEHCWLCDMFGYFNVDLKPKWTRRTSPLKATGMWGQIRTEIITDMIFRYGMDEKDHALAHVQLSDNIFRGGVLLDLSNIGVVTDPIYGNKGKKVKKSEGSGTKRVFSHFETYAISAEERKERAVAIVDSIMYLSDFAKQSRGPAVTAPRILIATLQPRYHQLLMEALELNNKAEVDIEELRVTLQDIVDLDSELVFGFRPGILPEDNGEALVSLMAEFDVKALTPVKAMKCLMEKLQEATLEEHSQVTPWEK